MGRMKKIYFKETSSHATYSADILYRPVLPLFTSPILELFSDSWSIDAGSVISVTELFQKGARKP